MTMKVIYHANCNDGFAAAWAAWLKFGPAAEFIPANYGDPPPPVLEDDVYIVDFSYPRDILVQMSHKANRLVVLDHHKSAQSELADLPFCTFDMSQSGAMLAWNHFFPALERPWIINYIQDRDLWHFALEGSKAINATISSWPYDFEYWSNRSRQPIEDIKNDGDAILLYIETQVARRGENARICRFPDDNLVPVMNATEWSSELGHYLLGKYPEAPFSVTWFQDIDGRYRYSLRSRGDFDVSELARCYGGGGHKSASGFATNTLLVLS